MSGNARFAFALVLWWLAALGFFVAFHPGGIKVNGHPADNPADVIKYMMQRSANNPDAASGNGGQAA